MKIGISQLSLSGYGKIGGGSQPVPTIFYPLNASEGFISAATAPTGTTYTKLDQSQDQQTGIHVLELDGTQKNNALIGNFTSEDPIIPVYLNDISLGQGNFAFEVHVEWPLTNDILTTALGFAGVQFRNLSTTGHFQQGLFSTNTEIITEETRNNVVSILIYDDPSGKRVQFRVNGVETADQLFSDILSTAGLDLSSLFVFMYIQEQPFTTTNDIGKFVDPNPEIKCRFVIDPVEMKYLPVIPGTKSIAGDKIIVPYEDDIHTENVVSLMHFDDELDLYKDEVAGNVWTPAITPSSYTQSGKFGGGLSIPFLAGESTSSGVPPQQTANSMTIPVLDGDYTVEFYIKFQEAPANGYSVPFLRLDNVALNNGIRIVLADPPSGPIGQQIMYTTTGLTDTNTGNSARITISPDKYEHFVIQRQGTNTYIYRNGIRHPNPVKTTFNGNFDRIFLGHVGGNWSQWKPFSIDELRITKGVARYSANFVPVPIPYEL